MKILFNKEYKKIIIDTNNCFEIILSELEDDSLILEFNSFDINNVRKFNSNEGWDWSLNITPEEEQIKIEILKSYGITRDNIDHKNLQHLFYLCMR